MWWPCTCCPPASEWITTMIVCQQPCFISGSPHVVSLILNLDDHMYILYVCTIYNMYIHTYIWCIYIYTYIDSLNKHSSPHLPWKNQHSTVGWLATSFITAPMTTSSPAMTSSPALSPDPDGDDPEVIFVGLMRTGLQSLHRAFSILGDLEF